jgi:hypothetical protein
MRRSFFVTGVGATALNAATFARAGHPAMADTPREGALTTQGALFDSLPRPVVHDWTRIILGSGVLYQKQIGVGEEIAADGSRLPYYELQVGSPGGSCNPSTMRKAYLKGSQFGSLFATYPLISNIGRTENMVYRYGDVEGGGTPAEHGDTTLRILDEDYLYDPRPLRIMSVAPQRIHEPHRHPRRRRIPRPSDEAASSRAHGTLAQPALSVRRRAISRNRRRPRTIRITCLRARARFPIAALDVAREGSLDHEERAVRANSDQRRRVAARYFTGDATVGT